MLVVSLFEFQVTEAILAKARLRNTSFRFWAVL